MHKYLNLIIIACFALILLLTAYLMVYLYKRHLLKQLYAGSTRDFRFVCELLRLYGNKQNVLKNPCLLRSYEQGSPRADAIVVGGGGILILTVADQPGQYTTPSSGDWSIWQNGEVKQIPNAFIPGRQYTSVLSGILMKCGLSCPISNVVVLTDDHAEADALHAENVLTGAQLVPFVKQFCRSRMLNKQEQKKLKNAIRQQHENCQRQLSSAMAGESKDAFETLSDASNATEVKPAEVEADIPEMRTFQENESHDQAESGGDAEGYTFRFTEADAQGEKQVPEFDKSEQHDAPAEPMPKLSFAGLDDSEPAEHAKEKAKISFSKLDEEEPSASAPKKNQFSFHGLDEELDESNKTGKSADSAESDRQFKGHNEAPTEEFDHFMQDLFGDQSDDAQS